MQEALCEWMALTMSCLTQLESLQYDHTAAMAAGRMTRIVPQDPAVSCLQS